jgi:hypothetical protein
MQVYVSNAQSTWRGLLVTRAGGYVLQIEPAEVDLVRFEALVAEGGRSRRTGELLREALGMWRGPACRLSRMRDPQSDLVRL